MEGVTYEEPQGLDVPSESDTAATNRGLVEIRFVTQDDKPEHKFSAKRSLIEAHFPGLGGVFEPQLDEVTGAYYHIVKLPRFVDDPTKPDWSGKTAEEVYRYYDHYMKTSGKLPNFPEATLRSHELKDVPGVTEYELKMFAHSTPEETDHLLEIMRVSNYICGKQGPCFDMATLAAAHIYDSLPIDQVLHCLRLDGRAYDMTPEEMEQIIAENAYLFDSWLTLPQPESSVSNSSSNNAENNNNKNQKTESVPIVELD